MTNIAFQQQITEKNSDTAIFVKAFSHPFFDFSFHYHPEYEIMLIENGSGKQIIGNSISNYQNRTLLFIGKNLAHGWKSVSRDESDKTLTEAVFIQFGDDFLGNDFFKSPEMVKANEILELSRYGIQITGSCMDKISGIMKDMVEQKGINKVISLLQIFDTLIKNPEYRLLCESDYMPSAGSKRDMRLQEIYHYMFENFSTEINIDKIANKMGMSKSAFCHFFKKHFGRPFTFKLNQLRIKQACYYLSNTNLPITQICFDCGYQSISYFNKMFREISKYSPRQYREEFTKNL
jgi:AraC-like DNA-binding protein